MKVSKSRLLIVGVVISALALVSFAVWHVSIYRSESGKVSEAITNCTTSIETTKDKLASNNPSDFIKAVAELNLLWKDIESIEATRRDIHSRATWLQRTFCRSVPDNWNEKLEYELRSTYTTLPDSFAQQTQTIMKNLEMAASRAGSSNTVRSEALAFKNKLSALKATAIEAESIARDQSIGNIAISNSISRNKRALEIEKWLDLGFSVEQKALRQLQNAVSQASMAARATTSLEPDATSSDVRRVLDLWSRAQDSIKAVWRAMNESDPGTPPSENMLRILRPIFQSTGARIEEVEENISRNKMAVEAVYREAVSEESNIITGFARAVRRGVRKAGNNLKQLGAAANRSIEDIAGRLATTIQEGVNNTITAAAMVTERGLKLYQDSRKSDLQRFVESGEGQTIIIGGFCLLGLLMLVGAAMQRK